MKNLNFFENLESTYFIAEIGVNHNGDLDLAKKLIDEAFVCGANAVKFQSYNSKKLASSETPKVPYQIINSNNPDESHQDMLLRYELSEQDHIVLNNYCIEKKIDFLSTPYDVENAILLNRLNVKMFKVASADIVDFQLHKYISSTKKPVVISTGMSTISDIENALGFYDLSKSSIVLLHCVSNYPCSLESINLNSLEVLSQYFNLPVGYSDHSSENLSSMLSIAQNAKVIEKHFTLDKKMLGPDHKASSNPQELNELIRNIRKVEKILGKNTKTVQKEELEMRKISRKSVYLKNDVSKNQYISENDVILQRPGFGINPMDFVKDIGKKYTRSKKKGELLKSEDIDSDN